MYLFELSVLESDPILAFEPLERWTPPDVAPLPALQGDEVAPVTHVNHVRCIPRKGQNKQATVGEKHDSAAAAAVGAAYK